MKLIGIAGRKGSGKDTFAQPLLEAHYGGNHRFVQVRFADPFKDMMRAMLTAAGLNPEYITRCIEGDLKEAPLEILGGMSMRHAMQTLGTEWGRAMLNERVWTNIAVSRIQNYAALGIYGVVITDVRHPDEVDAIKSLGGKVIKIHGRSVPNELSNHSSERLIGDLVVDMTVYNTGTIEILHNIAIDIASRTHHCNL